MNTLGLLSLLIFCTIIVVHVLIFFKCLNILSDLKMRNVKITRFSRYLAKKQLKEILKSPDYSDYVKQKAEDLLFFFSASIWVFFSGICLLVMLFAINGIFSLGLEK